MSVNLLFLLDHRQPLTAESRLGGAKCRGHNHNCKAMAEISLWGTLLPHAPPADLWSGHSLTWTGPVTQWLSDCDAALVGGGGEAARPGCPLFILDGFPASAPSAAKRKDRARVNTPRGGHWLFTGEPSKTAKTITAKTHSPVFPEFPGTEVTSLCITRNSIFAYSLSLALSVTVPWFFGNHQSLA